MKKITNRLATVVFPVVLSALVTGNGLGGEPAESVIAPSHDTIARTVGTVKAPDGVDIRYEVAGSGDLRWSSSTAGPATARIGVRKPTTSLRRTALSLSTSVVTASPASVGRTGQ